VGDLRLRTFIKPGLLSHSPIEAHVAQFALVSAQLFRPLATPEPSQIPQLSLHEFAMNPLFFSHSPAAAHAPHEPDSSRQPGVAARAGTSAADLGGVLVVPAAALGGVLVILGGGVGALLPNCITTAAITARTANTPAPAMTREKPPPLFVLRRAAAAAAVPLLSASLGLPLAILIRVLA